jgi:LysR family transcriptional regulator, regulator for bpeEF and oprC
MSLLWSPANLAVFARVVDLNGFSSAARALGVPKAAVSRAVADLEQHLGLKVLQRTTRRISLTAAGKLIYPHARRLFDEAEAARALALRFAPAPSGPMRVAADPTYGRVLLAPLVPRFLESFPDVMLDVSLQPVEGAPQWDVAIQAGLPADSAFEYRLLGTPPAVLCATPAYLLQRGEPTRPEDLRQHDLLTPEGDGPEVRIELSHGAQRAEVRLRPKLAVNDPAVLHASAAAGLGIGLLPEFLCRQGLATVRLKRVLEEWSVPSIASLYAVYPRTLTGDTRVERFVEFLAANIVPALAVPTPLMSGERTPRPTRGVARTRTIETVG